VNDGSVAQIADGLCIAEEVRARRLAAGQDAAASDLELEPFRGDVQPACKGLDAQQIRGMAPA
jgi:hypothetical protein